MCYEGSNGLGARVICIEWSFANTRLWGPGIDYWLFESDSASNLIIDPEMGCAAVQPQ